MGQILQADLLNKARNFKPRTTKYGRITRGEGRNSMGQPPPYRKGRWPSAPALHNFGSSLLFMDTPFDAELPNLTW